MSRRWGSAIAGKVMVGIVLVCLLGVEKGAGQSEGTGNAVAAGTQNQGVGTAHTGAAAGGKQNAGAGKTGAASGTRVNRIAGVVVDAETGSPVAGAELSITEETVELKAMAGGDGRFAFEGLAPGKYALAATAPGYVNQGYDQHAGFSTAIVVGSGADSENLVFRLHRQGVIEGTVTDERGEAVRNAQVMLFEEDASGRSEGPRMMSQKETNDLGAYRFAHLLAGRYYVAVSARPWYAQNNLMTQPRSFEEVATTQGDVAVAANMDPKLDVVYATTFYSNATDERGAAELVVNAGETQQADVRLQAMPAMHIRLTNMPTQNPNEQSVSIGAMKRILGSINTGLPVVMGEVAPGVYELGGLPPGELTLQLNERVAGTWEDRRIVRVNVSDGESVDANGAVAGANVTGRVIPADGSVAMAQGNVMLTGKQHDGAVRRLEKDGTFSFGPMEADTYQVFVNLGADGEYIGQLTAIGAKASAREVKIEGSEDVQLVIRMARGLGQVKGVVKMDGKPRAGVMVMLVPESEAVSDGRLQRERRIDQSDSDGSFALSAIVPGRYVLMAIEDGWSLEWANAEAMKPYRAKGHVVEMAGSEVKNVEIEAERREESGKVKE